jgi:hypothetical protein
MSDSDMQEIDPKFESYRHDHGTGSYAHVLLIRNEETGDTILVYAVWQMASCIGSVSMNICFLPRKRVFFSNRSNLFYNSERISMV